ncbi:tripartite ATP-independent transporter DctM subunit [Alloalcanivorax xenomutans]|uniref:TRAP transporter large permease n=1 Tax=Alloalcanivorax xenomutans TaxID=1094342 RepID=UPI000BCC075E|nr:TRAP transporter large permease [Alloalcanivorax xenomutans]SOC09018.1 tripartite ATP-independent transporter DctM subunit [Alloalcanivorax xenomutans]
MIILIGVGLLVVLLLMEMPIAFAMMVAATVGLWLVGGELMVHSFLADAFHNVTASYTMLTIPMFVLMAQYMAQSGMARDIITCSDTWLRRLNGGLGMACVFASAFMAAIIGSSTASCATMSSAAFPSMRDSGYDRRISVGIIAIAGTLAIMIPPSIVLIIYGILTQQSVGKLLIAGLVPGLLTAAGYILTIWVLSKRRPDLVPKPTAFDMRDTMKSLRPVWPAMLLMVVTIGGLYSGLATPTEIGAVGSLAALAIVLMMRRIDKRRFTSAMTETLGTTVMIITIIIGAMMFGYFLTLTQATQSLIAMINDANLSPWAVLLTLVVIYLVLGMLMDQMAILVLTVPVTFALITQLGFDGIWYGIVITKTVEIGLVTPPLGLNVFITSGITRVPVAECFRGVAPFVLVDLLILGLLLAFPEISLFLPGLMK